MKKAEIIPKPEWAKKIVSERLQSKNLPRFEPPDYCLNRTRIKRYETCCFAMFKNHSKSHSTYKSCLFFLVLRSSMYLVASSFIMNPLFLLIVTENMVVECIEEIWFRAATENICWAFFDASRGNCCNVTYMQGDDKMFGLAQVIVILHRRTQKNNTMSNSLIFA